MNENQENNNECEYDLCDGSGIQVVGKFDDIEERPCPCAKVEIDEYDNRLD